MLNSLIIGVTVLTGAILLYPRLANAPLWRAAITPLASPVPGFETSMSIRTSRPIITCCGKECLTTN